MEELSGRSWDYTLYRNGADLILSVVCGTVGIYEVNVKLDKEKRGIMKMREKITLPRLPKA